MTEAKKSVAILGTRGIPAGHGGFETLAEHLAQYLVNNGWHVTVYNQKEGKGAIYEDSWQGVKLVNIPVKTRKSIHTIIFDLKSIIHAARTKNLILSLGYGTAVFWLFFRLKRVKNVCNMDGMEWHRKKWILLLKLWLRINEKAACYLANHLIADCPAIYNYLSESVSDKKLTMIPYGAYHITDADENLLEEYGLEAQKYVLTICRIEEDNSLLEIVAAFNSKKRNEKLVIVGGVDFNNNRYHQKLMTAANSSTVFLGPVYEIDRVNALRKFARLYVHGHTVGGTNPSLVEAMGAELPVLARSNNYNKWVAGSKNHYFTTVEQCSKEFDSLLDNDEELSIMRKSSYEIFKQRFQWKKILREYEELLINQI